MCMVNVLNVGTVFNYHILPFCFSCLPFVTFFMIGVHVFFSGLVCGILSCLRTQRSVSSIHKQKEHDMHEC